MSEQPGDGYTRVTNGLDNFPPAGKAGWGTFTYAVVYDAAPPRRALDFVRASNRWPTPYSTVLWLGEIP